MSRLSHPHVFDDPGEEGKSCSITHPVLVYPLFGPDAPRSLSCSLAVTTQASHPHEVTTKFIILSDIVNLSTFFR